MRQQHSLKSRTRLNFSLRLITILVFATLLFACSDSDRPGDNNTLRFSVLPDQQWGVLQKRYEPLLGYLEAEVGIKCELIISQDYRDLLGKFMRDEIDIARFGGVTFTMARSISQAEPLVMRDIDKNFRSHFLVHANSTAKTIAEFKGKLFAFGSRFSTSGHLMPRYFLKEENIVPETFFSEIRYSGAHDRTANWVSNGNVDIGVANAEVIDMLLSQKGAKALNIRILKTTQPYADYVWAARKTLPETVKQKITAAFLKLSKQTAQGGEILGAVSADAYLPALNSDFDILQETAHQLGLLGETKKTNQP